MGHPVKRYLPPKSEPALAYWDLGDGTQRYYRYPRGFDPRFGTDVFAPAQLPEGDWPDHYSFGTALVEMLLGEIGQDFYFDTSKQGLVENHAGSD